MLNRILIIALVMCTAAGVWAIYLLLDEPIERLQIAGDLSAREQTQVRDLLSQQQTGGILSTDIHQLRSDLLALQWARDVQVSRIWPAALSIKILRQQPMARWGERQYITTTGKLVRMPDKHTDLPVFQIALSTPEQTMQRFILLRHLLADTDLRVQGLRESAQGEWVVHFADGFSLQLGATDLTERMARFLKVYEGLQVAERQHLEVVDLRYSSGVAIRFDESEDNLMVAKR